MICKNCKYWERNKEKNLNYGGCNSNKFEYDEGGYSSNSVSATPDNKNDELFYWDFEGYRAGFSTGENFGCVHFLDIGV
jgi:hypothetical protein